MFLLILLGGIFFIVCKSGFFAVKKIDCLLDSESCSPEIWNELISLTFRENLIFLKKKEISKKILNNYQIIKSLRINKVLPNKLIFELERRRGVATLGFEKGPEETASSSGRLIFGTGKNFYVVDEEGVVIKKENDFSLPLILLSEEPNLEVGRRILGGEVIGAIRFLTILRLNLLEPKIAKINFPYSLDIWLRDGRRVVFSLKKEAQIQIESLQFILSRSKIEGREIKKIDLRFDKPVIEL